MHQVDSMAPRPDLEREYRHDPVTGGPWPAPADSFVRRQLEAFESLQDLSLTLAAEEPGLLLAEIAERAARILGADAGAIYVAGLDNGPPPCVASYNPCDGQGLSEHAQELAGRIMQAGEPLAAPQVSLPDRQGKASVPEAPRTPAVGLPLFYCGMVVGALLAVRQPGASAFAKDDLNLLSPFAAYASVILQNGQLGERLCKEMAEKERLARQIEERCRADETQSLLYRIASAAQTTRDERTLFSAIRDELGTVLDTTNFFVALYDRKEDAITLSHFVDEKDHFETFPAGRTLTDFVIRQGRPLCVTRPEIEAMIEAGTVDLVGTPAAVWLGVPLEVSGEIIGALVVQSYTDEDAFGPEEQEILCFVSSQIGLSAERVRAEEELRQLKEFNESIVHNMAEGIVVQDTGGQFTFVNPAAGAMLGYDPDELVGEYWTKTVPVDQYDIVQAADKRRRKSETDRYVMDLLHRDGRRFPVLVSGSPLVDTEEGSFEGTIAVFTDISEQVRAEMELARHAQEMAALYETSLEINSQRNLEILLSAIVERASKLLNSSMGGLYLVQPGADELELVVGYNLPADYAGLRLSLGEGLSGRVAQTGEPMLVTDYSHWEGRSEIYESTPLQRVLAVPMRVGDRVIGVINIVDDDQTEPFLEDEIRLVSLFADQAAIAVENARLLEAERQQRELAEALRQATAAVGSTLDLDQILDDILEQVDRVIPGDAASIALIEGETAQTVRSRGYRRFGTSVQGLRLRLSERPNLCWMRDTGEPIIVPDVQEHPGWGAVAEVAWIRSYAGAPIRLRDQVIGFLNVDSATPGFFTAAHADRLRAFADQASLALANADLFHIAEQGKRDWEVTFNAMQDPVVLVDGEQRVVRANKAFAALVERSLAQVIEEDLGALLAGQICSAGTCPLEYARQNPRLATCIHGFGGRMFEVQVTPVKADGANGPGSSVRLIYALRDISEWQKTQEEIHRRNRELAFLNRIIAASAMGQTIDVLLKTVCRELAQFLGVPRAATLLLDEARAAATVAAEYQTATYASSLGETRRLAEFPGVEHLVRRAAPLVVDDVRVDPKLADAPEFEQRGTVSWLLLPLSVQGIVVGGLEVDSTRLRPFSAEEVDLAQRVADQVSNAIARAQLEETQRRLSAAVEQAAEAVVITDADSTIRYANPAFERITGFLRTDVIGRTPRQLRQSEEHASAYLQILRSMTAGQDWQGRLSATRADGTPYVVDIYVSPVRNQAGETVNYVATMRDVTREVQLEGQFQQAQKMEALGRLAGGIAHDFNNLLTVIHLSIRLVERQLRSEDPLWEHVQQIRQTGERAAKLTKQLLSFSRREVVDPRVLSVNQVVCDLSRMLQRIIGEDVELMTRLDDDLWRVKSDPAQIEQVIMNLAVNARDALPGGGTLTIETQNVTLDEGYCAFHVEAQQGDHVVLKIGDTGEGMDAEVKAHLFEPFFTTKERGQGTGLGLSTVFGIVRQSNGHIRVESQLNRGTKFLIYLPRCEQDRYGGMEDTLEAEEAGLVGERKTVLVVEDEANVRRLAVRVLGSYGYEVLEAADGSSALLVSEDHQGGIDLLITDVVMPQMNGKELADRLQRDRPLLPVLYMSGYPDREIFGEGGLPSDSIFLPKPFSIEELVQKVQSVLDGRS